MFFVAFLLACYILHASRWLQTRTAAGEQEQGRVCAPARAMGENKFKLGPTAIITFSGSRPNLAGARLGTMSARCCCSQSVVCVLCGSGPLARADIDHLQVSSSVRTQFARVPRQVPIQTRTASAKVQRDEVIN